MVSVLFNEPKLLKSTARRATTRSSTGFSALQRAEIAEIGRRSGEDGERVAVSVLFNEPKLLKSRSTTTTMTTTAVSVLFNEPKLLKSASTGDAVDCTRCFSALQRAEIAEIDVGSGVGVAGLGFQCSSTSRNC